MKSFAVDEKPIDIEELNKLKCVNNPNKTCKRSGQKNVHIIKDTLEWYSPNNLDDLFKLLVEYQSSAYRIVSGNTGTGVYKNEGPFEVFIDIKYVPDLYQVVRNPAMLSIGASVQLTNLIDIFNDYSSTNGFQYLTQLSHHISKIGNISVRNAASWSGNLMMKYNHQDFPSDVFICFETIGATLTLVGPDVFTPPIVCTPAQLLSVSSLNGKLFYSVGFKPLDDATTIVKTFKIMPRSQNAHAYVRIFFYCKYIHSDSICSMNFSYFHIYEI